MLQKAAPDEDATASSQLLIRFSKMAEKDAGQAFKYNTRDPSLADHYYEQPHLDSPEILEVHPDLRMRTYAQVVIAYRKAFQEAVQRLYDKKYELPPIETIPAELRVAAA